MLTSKIQKQKTAPLETKNTLENQKQISPNVNAKDVAEFLRFVAEGEQDKAEAMLKKNPALALIPGNVTDLSKRIFTSITGFQYAVWALDWHMWQMIRKYLPDEAAREQAQIFETGVWVKTHGVHANLDILIQAHQTSIDLYGQLKYDEGNKAWIQQVGGAQLLLPAHVINEYCHPTRPFYPTPNFKDTLALPRSRMIDEGEWFTASYAGGKLGEKFAIYRGARGARAWNGLRMALGSVAVGGMGCSRDAESIRTLAITRTGQREELVIELKPTTPKENNPPGPAMLAGFKKEVAKPIVKVNASDLKELEGFLRLVAEGEQDKVEAILESSPVLALLPGDVTDLSKRTFNNITGFQYAVWALDWHMWTMIRKYLPDEAVIEQARGFETGTWVEQQGVHAQGLLDNLIKAYQTTIDLYNTSKYDEGNTALIQKIGGAQRLLPAHVVNEYCHPTRSFKPDTNFRDTLILPRSRMIKEGEWFTASFEGGTVGNTFAVRRGKLPKAETVRGRIPIKLLELKTVRIDLQRVFTLTDTRTAQRKELIAEMSLRTALAHDLQEIEKEKQVLEQTSQELKTQSTHLQETLEKEITAQKAEYTRLGQQQEAFQKQIADLESSLIQKSGIEHQKLQTDLEALQEQSLIVKTHQDILWNEHEIKAKRREALKRFQSHPNLLLFYRTVHIKLEEIFISFKAVAGGFVNPVDGNIAIAKSIFDAIGDAASIAPIFGTAVEKILKWSVSKGLGKLDSTRQKNTAINASALATLSEVKKYAESIARQLTERYADQLQRLATAEEEQAETHKLKKAASKAKEAVLKDTCIPPAKQLAAFGVLWIIDQLDDAANIDESKGLDEALLSMISQKTPANKLKEFWQVITTKLGIQGVRSKSGEIWHPEAVYTLPGLRVGNEYYSIEKLQPKTYGWRLGTVEEVQALGLKQVQAPTTQAFILENQKVVQSISAVNNAVKEIKQEAEQHHARLEKMEKTGDIVGGARLRALQEKQEMDGKTIEEMRLQIAQLKSIQDARALSPSPKRRPSGIKDFTKQSEQENTLDALKELRKFFLGQRDKGEESTNIETYEKYLKMANKDADLIYQQEDRVHVLCIDGNVLNRTAAAQAIGNMIKTLELQTQSTVPAAHQPMRSVSPAPANSLQAIPTVVPISSPTQPQMLTQFNQPAPPARRAPARQLISSFRNGLTREG